MSRTLQQSWGGKMKLRNVLIGIQLVGMVIGFGMITFTKTLRRLTSQWNLERFQLTREEPFEEVLRVHARFQLESFGILVVLMAWSLLTKRASLPTVLAIMVVTLALAVLRSVHWKFNILDEERQKNRVRAALSANVIDLFGDSRRRAVS